MAWEYHDGVGSADRMRFEGDSMSWAPYWVNQETGQISETDPIGSPQDALAKYKGAVYAGAGEFRPFKAEIDALTAQGVPIYQHPDHYGMISLTQHDPSWQPLGPIDWQRYASTSGTKFMGKYFLPAVAAMMGYGALSGLGAGAAATEGAAAGTAATEGAAAGATAAEGASVGVSAGAGGEFTGGLTGAVQGSPGLAAGSFNSASLGAGGASAAPGGLALPAAGVTGAGALSAGSLAGEALYPVLGGAAASAGASQLGAASAGSVPATAGAASTAGGTALSRILGGTATDADWLSVLGTAGATGLGIYGANQQANALRDIANQSRADRAPFLSKANEWLSNPAAYAEGPGQASLSGVLRGLSVKGNPAGMPSSMGLATEAGLRNWQNAVTGFANIGLSGEDSRNQLMSNAAGADGGALNAIGYGLNQLTNPPTSLEQLLRQMGTKNQPSLV